MSRRTTRRLVGGTATGLALGATALALLAGPSATAGGGAAVEERTTAMQQFAIFRTASRGGGSEVDATVAASAERAGVDASEAREAAMPLGAPSVTVVPRQEALCVYVGVDGEPASAYGCAPWADALEGRTYLTLSGGPDLEPGAAVVAGVVPDGAGEVVLVDEDGAQTLEVSDGVYAAETTAPESLSVTGPSGTTSTFDLGGLPGVGE